MQVSPDPDQASGNPFAYASDVAYADPVATRRLTLSRAAHAMAMAFPAQRG